MKTTPAVITPNEEPTRLTIDDPVSPEYLEALGQLDDAHSRLALELMGLEQRKVQILSSCNKVDRQRNSIFERILVERGLPLNTIIDLDPRTGSLKVIPKVSIKEDTSEG